MRRLIAAALAAVVGLATVGAAAAQTATLRQDPSTTCNTFAQPGSSSHVCYETGP